MSGDHMAQVAALTALHGPTSAELARALPDVADGLHAQLLELSARPDPERCERVAFNLAGAHKHVLRLREAQLREPREGSPNE